MKRLTSTERAQTVVKALNEFRIVFPNAFTSQQLTLQLKSINCPWAKNIFSVLNKTHQIKSIGKSQYVFKYAEPVYYKAIQATLDELVESFKLSQYKWLGKESKGKTESLPIIDCSIEEAIALLKGLGYKISKPVTTYEEI